MKLRVGTRRSRLAVTQTKQVCDLLRAAHPQLEFELVRVETTGDRIQDRPLRESGGKGLFVKELDESLLAGTIDCAVHSLKDVPSVLPEEIVIAAIPPRADARDVLLSLHGWSLDNIAEGAVFGTTSLRRAGQLLQGRPTITVKMLRGNVETRIRRIADGDFDGTFLAAAGLARLKADLTPLVAVALPPASFVPAPGQGALCITARRDALEVLRVVQAVDHAETRGAAVAERSLAAALGGSCYVPLGAYAGIRGAEMHLRGVVVSPDGVRAFACSETAPVDAARELGERVARRLLADGAGEVIAAAERAGASS